MRSFHAWGGSFASLGRYILSCPSRLFQQSSSSIRLLWYAETASESVDGKLLGLLGGKLRNYCGVYVTKIPSKTHVGLAPTLSLFALTKSLICPLCPRSDQSLVLKVLLKFLFGSSRKKHLHIVGIGNLSLSLKAPERGCS